MYDHKDHGHVVTKDGLGIVAVSDGKFSRESIAQEHLADAGKWTFAWRRPSTFGSMAETVQLTAYTRVESISCTSACLQLSGCAQADVPWSQHVSLSR